MSLNFKIIYREVDDLDYLKDYSADFPNLLEYDLQAIYKKDGLQFDERWQVKIVIFALQCFVALYEKLYRVLRN